LAKTVWLSDETHRDLMTAKLEFGYGSVDELVRALLSEVRKAKLLRASEVFTRALEREGITLSELMDVGETTRGELFREWFGKLGP